MRWAFKYHLGDSLSGACSGGRISAAEATHHRLPHHDEDEAVSVINGTSAAGRMKDRGVHELVPLVGRI